MKGAVSLEIQDISCSIRDVQVLHGLSLMLSGGRICGITGENGCGKTVLFQCICGLLPCEAGEIRINGRRLETAPAPDVGILIGEPGFLGRWSGSENLEFLWEIRHRHDRTRIASVLEQVGLEPSLKIPVAEYSLGMRKRLAIAQALLDDPDILVLDQPMDGLDKGGVFEIRLLLRQLRREGRLIIFSSHDQEDLRLLCDEAYELRDGTLKPLGGF